jgi:hypothetical protein
VALVVGGLLMGVGDLEVVGAIFALAAVWMMPLRLAERSVPLTGETPSR